MKEDLKARGSERPELEGPREVAETRGTMVRSLSVSSEPRRPPAAAAQEEPGASRTHLAQERLCLHHLRPSSEQQEERTQASLFLLHHLIVCRPQDDRGTSHTR